MTECTVTFEELRAHWNHKVVIVGYCLADGTPVNMALECEDCHSVIADCNDTDEEG